MTTTTTRRIESAGTRSETPTRPAPRLSFLARWQLHHARNVFIREQLARVDGLSRLDRECGLVSGVAGVRAHGTR